MDSFGGTRPEGVFLWPGRRAFWILRGLFEARGRDRQEKGKKNAGKTGRKKKIRKTLQDAFFDSKRY